MQQDKKSTYSEGTEAVGFSLCKKYVIMIKKGARKVNYTKQVREYCEQHNNSLIDISIVRDILLVLSFRKIINMNRNSNI